MDPITAATIITALAALFASILTHIKESECMAGIFGTKIKTYQPLKQEI